MHVTSPHPQTLTRLRHCPPGRYRAGACSQTTGKGFGCELCPSNTYSSGTSTAGEPATSCVAQTLCGPGEFFSLVEGNTVCESACLMQCPFVLAYGVRPGVMALQGVLVGAKSSVINAVLMNEQCGK